MPYAGRPPHPHRRWFSALALVCLEDVDNPAISAVCLPALEIDLRQAHPTRSVLATLHADLFPHPHKLTRGFFLITRI